jgi:hypothetical protein
LWCFVCVRGVWVPGWCIEKKPFAESLGSGLSAKLQSGPHNLPGQKKWAFAESLDASLSAKMQSRPHDIPGQNKKMNLCREPRSTALGEADEWAPLCNRPNSKKNWRPIFKKITSTPRATRSALSEADEWAPLCNRPNSKKLETNI